MDNAILFTACLIFGWLVMYSWGFKRGYRLGREDEQDATTRRFIMFRIERFGVRNTRRYRPNGATRHAPPNPRRR